MDLLPMVVFGIITVIFIIYLSAITIRRIFKPFIKELREPSQAILDFAAQGNLDEFQKKALLSPYKETLIIAGAGAGKTAILTRRIILFAKHLKIPIQNMLVMAFNKDAAKEVAERVAAATGEKPEAFKDNIRTIHSFAYNIATAQNSELKILATDKELKNFVKQLLEKHKTGTGRTAYMSRVVSLLGNAQIRDKKNNKRAVPEPRKGIRCSDGTRVRSYAEKRIVEKLIQNGIRYEYEPLVTWADMYFEPDFFFPEFGIYAEYWGMMYHKNTALRDRYCRQMQWKKEQFKKYRFTLIDLEPKTAERPSNPEDYLISRLKKLQYGNFAALYQKKLESLFNPLEDKLIELIISAMDITMAYGIKMVELMPRADLFVKAILGLIIPICEELQRSMNLKNRTTYTGVLHLAVRRLRKDKKLLKSMRAKYSSIFVDEVQDLQPLTRQFIRLLTGKRQHLFAIGDDYQSIYSFAGSDPTFIVRFEHYFPQAKVMELKYNYRCHPAIVEISNRIIRNNKVQRFKKVIGKFGEGQNITDTTLTALTVSDDARHIESLADYLSSQIPEKETIQILGRYSESMPGIENFMSVIHQRFKGREYKYLTIHRSKGLQADNVIILGCVQRNDGAFCFPAEDRFHRLRDRILCLCRGNKFNLTEEEIRLFYVAVTRAKKRVFVVTVKGQESEFMNEKYLPADMIKRHNIVAADFSI